MFEYISASEGAKKWGISERKDAPKPTDGRIKGRKEGDSK